MKKSELIKIIKEELQKQVNLKEYFGGQGNSALSRKHADSDKLTNDLLGVMVELLREIARNTAGRTAGE